MRQEGELISPMGDTEDLTDVGMEREDLGPIMSMYSEVSVLLMSLLKIFLVFSISYGCLINKLLPSFRELRFLNETNCETFPEYTSFISVKM